MTVLCRTAKSKTEPLWSALARLFNFRLSHITDRMNSFPVNIKLCQSKTQHSLSLRQVATNQLCTSEAQPPVSTDNVSSPQTQTGLR